MITIVLLSAAILLLAGACAAGSVSYVRQTRPALRRSTAAAFRPQGDPLSRSRI